MMILITPTSSLLSATPSDVEAMAATVDGNQEGTVSRGGMVMHNPNTGTFVQADDRIPVHIFSESPEVPWIQPQDIIDLKGLFKKHDKNLFNTIVGGFARGQRVRLYTPDLKKFPEVYALVKKCISPYLNFVQTKYPSLQHYKLAALKTLPNAESQYERCNWSLHCDYDDRVNLRPPHDRPVSLMVAFDAFQFLYLKSRNDRRRDLITQVVHPGQAIAFTNYCLHAGGANPTPNECYRLFAYIASDPHDIPNGNVFQHRWIGVGDDVNDDRIGNVVSEAAANGEPTEVTRTIPGRSIVAPDKYGFPTKTGKKLKTKGKVESSDKTIVGIVEADAVLDPPIPSTADDAEMTTRIPSAPDDTGATEPPEATVTKVVPSAADDAVMSTPIPSAPDDTVTELLIPSAAVSVPKMVSIFIAITMTHPMYSCS
jgi:hypothetical protein